MATFQFKWNATTSPGWVVRWLSPGDYLALAVSSSDSKARLYKREADGTLSTLATSASALTLTSGTWYEAKVVIDNDPNDANLQQLRFWVDTDGDGDYGDETTLITTTAVDDVWSAGLVGLYRAASSSGAVQQYDAVKIGYDNNGDGDILDAGDDLQVSDDFASNVMSLTYDDNGNLTDDGVLRYVYDGWNRLRKVNRSADGDTTTLATYAYLPDNRRANKVVEKCGIEAVAGDGGDTTVHFYYGGDQSPDREGAVGGLGGTGILPVRWNVFETRNGSNQSTRQWVWGMGGTGILPVGYVDELRFMDVNGSPSYNNTCDPDVTDGSPTRDRRFFYHQDRNWNVVALTEYADGVGTNARVTERYAYTPYGEFVVLKGDAGSGELGRTLATSVVGNLFFHQGLPLDQETGSYQNRWRTRSAQLSCFIQHDPRAFPYSESGARLHVPGDPTLYALLRQNPLAYLDPTGLWGWCHNGGDETIWIRPEWGCTNDPGGNTDPRARPDCNDQGYAPLAPGGSAPCDGVAGLCGPGQAYKIPDCCDYHASSPNSGCRYCTFWCCWVRTCGCTAVWW